MADFISLIIILALIVGIFIAYFIGLRSGAFRRDKYWEAELPGHRKDAIMKSRSVLRGHFSEQIAPYLPGFSHSPNECKFIGKPIDFIAFKGLDGKDVEEIVFVEVKSGKSKLTPVEKKVKEAVDKKKVRWEEYRVPEDISSKTDLDEFH